MYIQEESFQPTAMSKFGMPAATALCMWVHAMKMYGEVFREVEPKRLKLKRAQETLERKLDEKTSAVCPKIVAKCDVSKAPVPSEVNLPVEEPCPAKSSCPFQGIRTASKTLNSPKRSSLMDIDRSTLTCRYIHI